MATGEFNLLHLAEDRLLAILKDALINNITKRLVSDFKKEIEPIIQNEVKKLVITMFQERNIETWRDELKLYMKWNGEEIL